MGSTASQGSWHIDTELIGQRHEVVLGVYVLDRLQPAVVAPVFAFIGTEIEYGGLVADVCTELAQVQVPYDVLTVAEPDTRIVIRNIAPQRFEVRVELDEVPGLRKPERAPRIEVIADDTLSGAVHDVVVDNVFAGRQMAVVDGCRHVRSSRDALRSFAGAVT